MGISLSFDCLAIFDPHPNPPLFKGRGRTTRVAPYAIPRNLLPLHRDGWPVLIGQWDALSRRQDQPAMALSAAASLFARWRRRRRARRQALAFTVWDLRERYGGAAAAIARSTAQRTVGSGRRRFWRKVAATLKRRVPSPNRY